ncbi:MAG: pyridoxamine 5'-phosphate oxidase family protein [Deltaproteobacteria bacterium]|nr:pyridoxamine 5'-phosphate oxidase family protein [Deltaproteobacteria bacterium]
MSKSVFEFFSANRPFYLATVNGDIPKVRPMGFIMYFEDKVWFGMGNHKNVYKQLQQNPNVEIVATAPDNNWLRLWGKAVFDDRAVLFQEALKAMPHLKDIYPPDAPYKMAIFHLKEATAQFLEITGTPIREVKF